MNPVTIVLLLLLSLAALGLLWMFRQWHRAEVSGKEAMLRQAAMQARLEEMERQMQPDATRQAMESVFRSLSQETLKSQGEQTAQRVQSDLGLLLKPMGEQVGDFRVRVEEMLGDSIATRAMLEEKFKRMDDSVQNLSQDANDLSAALRGDSKVLGNWGELSLVRALEVAGLKEGNDYACQVSIKVNETMVRPDAVIYLPDNRHVIIDAKVSLVAYSNYVVAADDQARKEALKDMKKAMAKQVDEIHTRYMQLPGLNTLGFAIMFTPLEPAWILVMAQCPELIGQARKKGVIIVGPTTLLATLRLVEQIWKAEHNASKVREIVDRAAKLCDGAVRLVERIDAALSQTKKIGDCLADIKKSVEGRQGLVFQAEKLRELRAHGKKEMPEQSVEASRENNPVAAEGGDNGLVTQQDKTQ